MERPTSGVDRPRSRVPAVLSVLLVSVALVPSQAIATDAGAPPLAPQDLLAAELAAAGEDYDGFLVVGAEASAWEQVRSLVTTGRRVDPGARAAALSQANGARVRGELGPTLPIVLVDADPAQASALAAERGIATVSPNVRVGVDRRVATVQSDTLRSWGLAVLDATAPFGAEHDGRYRYTSDGGGVEVYVFDTGILATHPDFVGRIATPSGGYFRITDRDAQGAITYQDPVLADADCDGHGTHVAGTIAGRWSGVAKSATLIPVKVFPACDLGGFVSDVIAGIAWLRTQYPAGQVDRPIVANMSLGAQANTAFDDAVRTLIADGVTVVVAAGNAGVLASGVSPARVAEAITVGATGATDGSGTLLFDVVPGYSNHGAAIDVSAPGTFIISSCAEPNRFGVQTIDGEEVRVSVTCPVEQLDGTDVPVASLVGTSMAAPHVAGVAARLLGQHYAQSGAILSPAQVMAAVLGGAQDVVRFARVNTSTLLASTRFLEPAGPTGVEAPAVLACAGAPEVDTVQLAIGGVGPFTWAVTDGQLPDGLALDARGILTGTVSDMLSGTSITVTVTDVFGRSATRVVPRSSLPPGCV